MRRAPRAPKRALTLGFVLALAVAIVPGPAIASSTADGVALSDHAPERAHPSGVLRPAAPGDNIADAGPLSPSPVVDTLDDQTDLDDVYEVPLNVGDRLQVYLFGDPSAVMDVSLFSPAAQSVLSDYNDRSLMVGDYLSTVYPDPLCYTAIPVSEGGWGAGTYYLDVWVASGSGSYTLYWEIIPANNQLYDVEVAGQDRVLTSVAVSQEAFPHGTDTVIVATGYNWPDALGAAPLARAVQAPILLTHTEYLDAPVLQEIRRLGAGFAYILGGTGAVGLDVEQALIDELGGGAVYRVAGMNRYETSHEIAREAQFVMQSLGSDVDDEVVIATGGDFPDALAVGPIAATGVTPIILEPPGPGLSAGTASIVAELGVRGALIVGGTGAVSAGAEAGLEAQLGSTEVGRIAGADRYETAVALAAVHIETAYDAGYGFYQADTVALTNGRNYPDALAGSMLQYTSNSVVLLTDPSSLSPITGAWLDRYQDRITTVRFVGGPGAVGIGVRDAAILHLIQ
jgi:putative cell wall-binding protein